MLFNSNGNVIELVKTGDRSEYALSQRRERNYISVTSWKGFASWIHDKKFLKC